MAVAKLLGPEVVTPLPREATIEEIKHYEDVMIQSALHMQRAGWDEVKISAIMSYFLASFLTPRTNKVKLAGRRAKEGKDLTFDMVVKDLQFASVLTKR